jgi:hypothetical protein
VLNNGLGRYEAALTAAQRSTEVGYELGISNWAVVELIEAAVRSGTSETAVGAYRRLAEQAKAAGTDWVLGLEARSHALLCEGAEAERLYRDAIERLGCTRARADLARAHLLYGEWLRRERRRGEARDQLRTACQMLLKTCVRWRDRPFGRGSGSLVAYSTGVQQPPCSWMDVHGRS